MAAYMHEVIDRHGGRKERVASEYLYLAGQLALTTDAFALRVSFSDEARVRAEALIAEETDTRTYGVIAPFTTRPQYHRTPGRWTELVPKLAAQYSASVVVLGGPGDVSAAGAIAAGCKVVNLVGRTDIQTAAAIIAGADYLVGVDTGLTHMGLAFRKPTVCLFGSTRPYTDMATPTGRVLYHKMSCAPCKRRPTCNGAFTCMTGITADEVIPLLDALLEPGGLR